MSFVPHELTGGDRRERLCWSFLAWSSTLLYLCGLSIADPDLWGHTLYGLRALEQGVAAESVDPFSWSAPDAEWINHEWLSEDSMAWAYRRWGDGGLVLWRNLWLLLLWLAVADAFWHRSASLSGQLVCLGFGALCLSDFLVFIRPQLATYALLAWNLRLLDRMRDPGRQWLGWLIPLVMIPWVNLHGGFLAGVGVTTAGCAAIAWETRSEIRSRHWRFACLAVIPVLTIEATFCNPYGARLHSMLWTHLVTYQPVREWQPLWATTPSVVYGVPFLLLGLALVGWRQWRPLEVVTVLVVGWQAVNHLRHIGLLTVTSLVLLPGAISAGLFQLFPLLHEQWSGTAGRRIRWAGLLLFCGALWLFHQSGAERLSASGLTPWQVAVEVRSDVPGVPARAVQWLADRKVQGRLLTQYGWGQYVLWHLYPDCTVGFDGRYRTIYPAEIEAQFLAFQELEPGDDPPELLDQAEIVLWPVEHRPLPFLVGRPEWVEVYRDDQASVWLRDQPAWAATLVDRSKLPETSSDQRRWLRFPGGPQNGIPVATSRNR